MCMRDLNTYWVEKWNRNCGMTTPHWGLLSPSLPVSHSCKHTSLWQLKQTKRFYFLLETFCKTVGTNSVNVVAKPTNQPTQKPAGSGNPEYLIPGAMSFLDRGKKCRTCTLLQNGLCLTACSIALGGYFQNTWSISKQFQSVVTFCPIIWQKEIPSKSRLYYKLFIQSPTHTGVLRKASKSPLGRKW